MLELFKEKHWVGEFFIPERYNERFTGEINYSPENGVCLAYSITGNQVPCESKIVHGVLATGEKCTLIGQFSPQNSGITLKNGFLTHRGKIGFLCLLIGDFLGEDELIFDINFSLTNLQEFFFPKGYKDLVKYSEKPLLSIKTSFGKIEVGNTRPLQ